ncbi:hypothetical protein C8F01DRAFT_1253147 [Mycena amicta]|nr:hypothetical protein C8F01DRAFT_1253147 [Mycena amicta]
MSFAPAAHQPPSPTQLNTIREEYHRLEVRVRRSLRMQLGDAARLSHQASQATRLLRMAEQLSALFPPRELDTLRRNIEQMLSSLASARDQSADPPMASSLVVLRKVPNGKGTGRPRLQIDSQFLGSTLNVLRGPTGIAKAIGCSARTVRRRGLEAGLVHQGPPIRRQETQPDGSVSTIWQSAGPTISAISNDPALLDSEVVDILQCFPSFGREMLSGALAARGLRFPRD